MDFSVRAASARKPGISGSDKAFNKTVPTYIIWQDNLYDIKNNKIKRVIE